MDFIDSWFGTGFTERGDARPGADGASVRRMSSSVLSGSIRGLDLALMLLCAWAVSPWAAPGPGGLPRLRSAALAVGIAGALWALGLLGTYAVPALRELRRQTSCIAGASLAGAAAFALALFATSDGSRDVRALALAWPAAIAVTLLASRAVLCPLVARWSSGGRLARRVAVIGVGPFSEAFVARLRAEPEAWEIVGIYDDRLARVPPRHAGAPVLGTVEDLVRQSRAERVDVIVVALPLAAADRIARILTQVGSTVADVCLTTDLAGLHYAGRQFDRIGANAVVSIREDPLKDWRAVRKSVFDRTLASLILLPASPVMLAIALLIRLDSPGPVLFRQPRLGFNNRLFCCFKFRTMHDAMADPLANRQATRGDKRVTRVGRWLRRSSLDELPQLFNVLGGSMSLVGPRPHAPNTRAAERLFGDVVAHYAVRHRVKPGITGWAQVNGLRGETRTEAEIEARVAHDLHYIEHWSLLLDLRILALTALREIWSRRAY